MLTKFQGKLRINFAIANIKNFIQTNHYFSIFLREIAIPPFTISLSQSTRKPLHRQVRGDACPNDTRRLPLLFGVDDLANDETLGVKRKAYHKIHNQDNPSDKHGRLPSSNFRRKVCYVPPMANQQSGALPAPILSETLAHPRYLLGIDRELANIDSYNNLAPAE